MGDWNDRQAKQELEPNELSGSKTVDQSDFYILPTLSKTILFRVIHNMFSDARQ